MKLSSKNIFFILAIIVVILAIAITLRYTLFRLPRGIQSIQAASAFIKVGEKDVAVVRISVDPGILSKDETSTKKIMQKLTVVACANGTCQFTDILPGLGFFTSEFKISADSKTLPLLVVACSHLGCVKKQLTADIDSAKPTTITK